MPGYHITKNSKNQGVPFCGDKGIRGVVSIHPLYFFLITAVELIKQN